MTDWTPAMVDERLVEAAAVLRRLPSVRMRGYFSTWPAMFVELGDLVDQTPEPMRLPPPSAAAISRMEAARPWLTWLEPDDARLVCCERKERRGSRSAGASASVARRRIDDGSMG